MIIYEELNQELSNPVRELVGRIELYVYDEDKSLVRICGASDALKNFTIERTGENKFFGYGICQKLNVHLVDTTRSINLTTKNYFEAVLGVGSEYIYPFPAFFITQVRRDENTNELSITAYDALYGAVKHTFSELNMKKFTIGGLAEECASVLGLPLNLNDADIIPFTDYYYEATHFDGTETIRQVLNYIAEVTQTVYYINNNWELTFKSLDRDGEQVFTIGKDKYFSLESRDNKRLGKISHITGLGDNISASITQSGSTQYLRENPLYMGREDLGDLLDAAIDRIGGLTVNQFELNWRGNWLLEIGDKIGLVTKDDKTLYSFLLNDTITYNGTLSQKTQWKFEDNEGETEDNPTTIGEALKRTYAKVDKVNQEITLFIGEKEEEIDTKLSEIQMASDSITATVQQTIKDVENHLDVFEKDIDLVTQKVEATMTPSDVELLISNTVSTGIQSVTTTTGFTFDETGLTVSKSNSPMSTTVTEDGMYVEKNGETMLSANQKGVEANNLKSNYIIISGRSRFEKYGSDRVGIYWLAGGE